MRNDGQVALAAKDKGVIQAGLTFFYKRTQVRNINNKIANGIILSALTVLSACASKDLTKWQEECIQTKEAYSLKGFSNVTYSPLPNIPLESQSAYVLDWAGLSIPIPKTTYQHVFISHESDNDLHVILIAENGIKIHASRFYDNEVIKNVFAKAGQPPNQEQIAWTNKALDKPIRHSDLIDLGFTTTLADIDCQADNQPKESVKLVSLALKNINPELISAHKLNLNAQSWVESRLSSMDTTTKTYTVGTVEEDRGGDVIKQIKYIVPNTIDGFNLYTMVSDVKQNGVKNPYWINALNKALETRSQADWENYFNLAKKNNISEKSLQDSRSILLGKN